MRRRFEVASAGVDENLQLVDSSPFRSVTWVGLRVPGLETINVNSVADPLGFDSRYLFNGCSIKLNPGQRIRLLGMRQLWSLGSKLTVEGSAPQFDEIDVTSPLFRMPDGNVSWHLRYIRQGEIANFRFGPLDGPNFAFQWSDGPSLLYLNATFAAANLNAQGKPDFYTTLTSYVPPAKGMPWGTTLISNLQTRHDAFTFWRDDHAWQSFGRRGVIIEGPGIISAQISVRQGVAPTLTPPVTFFAGGMLPERVFILNNPGRVKIWRVGAALIAESL